MEEQIKQLQKELEEIKAELKAIRDEALKIEHLEEYSQASNFPTLIAIILLQLFTIFLLGWIIFKGGIVF